MKAKLSIKHGKNSKENMVLWEEGLTMIPQFSHNGQYDPGIITTDLSLHDKPTKSTNGAEVQTL